MAEQKVNTISAGARFLYSYVFVGMMYLFFFVSSLFNNKTKRGLKGRKNLFGELRKKMSGVPEGKRIWFHASSFGEFEQAKPIIEILKEDGYNIVVSLFSPSGYEFSKSYPHADAVTYIPLDTIQNARRFVDIVKPSVFVVMRYDLWLNHLIAAKKFGAKIVLADATFPVKLFQRPDFLKKFFRDLYTLTDMILTTTSEHKKMFDFFLGSEKAVVVGDTRFDRVYNRKAANNIAARIPFTIDGPDRIVVVLGSTWRQDTDVLAPGLNRLLKKFASLTVLMVPHEPTTEEVGRLREQFPTARVMSEMNNGDNRFSFLIVDRVGILSQLYVLGDVAYVGGGFGAGVHNVLEPAVYGIPVITGPRIERSDEAIQLMQTGALFFVKDSAAAYRVLTRMVEDAAARKNAGDIAKSFVSMHLGASASVAGKVKELCGE